MLFSSYSQQKKKKKNSSFKVGYIKYIKFSPSYKTLGLLWILSLTFSFIGVLSQTIIMTNQKLPGSAIFAK